MKVCFETFGCRLNRAEALQMEADYLAKGWERTESHSDADLIVVRGCSVTRRAQRDCERLVAHIKAKYPATRLIVTGCLRDETAERVSPAVRRARAILEAMDAADDEDAETPPEIEEDEPIPMRTARAYLKIQDGCSGKCSFCIVPQFRGPSSSVSFSSLLRKTERFIEAGYTEIVLTGCNLVLYASEGRRLPELVDALARLGESADGRSSPRCRIRLGSIEPGACALETVDVMAARANVCRYLHVPAQSGADRILTAMRRPYLVRDVVELVERAKRVSALAGIGLDLMTGFPGETEMDFLSTEGLIKRLCPSNVHVFPYSERPGTIAAGLLDMIPRAVRHDRARRLAAVAKSHRSQASKKFIGQRVQIVIEDEKEMSGWTGEYFQCKIDNKGRCASVKRRDIVEARVTIARHGALVAAVV